MPSSVGCLKTHEFLRAAASPQAQLDITWIRAMRLTPIHDRLPATHARAARPTFVADVVGDEVLADFKFDVKQAASLAMRRIV